MKKKLFFITTLAATIAAAAIPSAVYASPAADTATGDIAEYPASFVRTLDLSADGLSDYAVDGDTYAFAVKTTIYVVHTDESGDRKLNNDGKGFKYGTEITALDYAEGKLYFKSTSGNAYVYSHATNSVTEAVSHNFPQTTYSLEIDANQYLLNNKSELKLFNSANGEEALLGDGFSSLKKFGGKAYAVKDDVPYLLEGQTATPLDLGYTDFSAADNIATGSLRYELKSGDYQIKTATLQSGKYYSQIDPDNVGQYFRHIRTLKAEGAISCLVLTSGAENSDEVSVLVADGNCYLTAAKNLTFSAYTPPANDWAQGPEGQRKAYLRESTGVYSCPFMSEGTKITQANATEAIAVTVQEKFSLDFIDADFYRISYSDANGRTVSGFVAAGFLDEYDYSADSNEPTTVGGEDFSYETNVTTVILVLVIVGLVIIAIVYLTIVGTRQDKNGKKKRKNKQDED